jgi:hypothetical protein
MMRTWAITKASRLKAVLSWTKTIWAMVGYMSKLRQNTRRSARQSTWEGARRSTRVKGRRNMRIRTRQKIDKLITIWVSNILNMPPLNSLPPEAKLIQVTSTATKHANKSFLSQLRGFFPCFSLWVEWLFWIGWIMDFGWFECFLFFMVAGARNKFRSTLFIFLLTSLRFNPQSVCGLSCTLLNPTQILLDHFLTQSNFLKASSQIGNLLLKLSVLFGSMEKLTLERNTCFIRRG